MNELRTGGEPLVRREVRCAWVNLNDPTMRAWAEQEVPSPAGRSLGGLADADALRAETRLRSELGKRAIALLLQHAGGAGERADRTLRSSVSHTRGLLAVAVSAGAVGIDVEATDGPVPDPLLVKRTLTRREQSRLLHGDDSAAVWYRYWVRREALGKCLGSGWSGPAVGLNVDRTIVVSWRRPAGVWWLTDLRAPAGFSAAVATPFVPKITWVTLDLPNSRVTRSAAVP